MEDVRDFQRNRLRIFETGATRDLDADKYDYEGFLSPLVLDRFAAYMHKHRMQVDGSLRASDNWQKGIPKDAYMKSGWRHFMAWWKLHRQPKVDRPQLEEALCALLFNAMGYLHEALKETAHAAESQPALSDAQTPEPPSSSTCTDQ